MTHFINKTTENIQFSFNIKIMNFGKKTSTAGDPKVLSRMRNVSFSFIFD